MRGSSAGAEGGGGDPDPPASPVPRSERYRSRRELADLYRERGELQEAMSELSILLWTEPSADAHAGLARVYLEMQEPGKAVAREVEKALALDPELIVDATASRSRKAPGSPPRNTSFRR